MEEAMREHTAQLERMLEEVEAWEGTNGAALSSRLSVLRLHSAAFREMIEEIELWKGTKNGKKNRTSITCLTK